MTKATITNLSRYITADCMIPVLNHDKNDKKELNLRSFVNDNVATRNFHAPWPSVAPPFETTTIATTAATLSLTNERKFYDFLLQRQNVKTTGDTFRYSKQYAYVLQTGDASPLLELSPDKRIHVQKALASLARFLGCYDSWLQIRKRYNLTWSTGNEALTTFERFFIDDSKSLDSMLQWVRKAIRILPAHMGNIIKLNCLLGLRASECIAAARLIANPETFQTLYNKERQTLEYFRFPQIYLRKTKNAFLSIITKEQLLAISILECKKTLPKSQAMTL